MDSVDIVHGLSGHYPWTEWTMSTESMDFLQMGSYQQTYRMQDKRDQKIDIILHSEKNC